MPKHPPSPAWLRRARILALLVNVASVWERFIPYFVGINLVFTASLLVLRRNGGEATSLLPWYCLAIALGCLWACLRCKKSFYTIKDALLRMETALNLKNRLSCAYAGTLEWPDASKYCSRAVGIRPHVALLPVFYSAAFILAGLWLPISSAEAKPSAADAVEPSAWTQVDDWAQLLKEERIVAAEEIETLEEQLSELRDRPKEEWYSQGSLEAGQTLRDETRLAMQELARQLESTSTLLEQMSEHANTANLDNSGVEQLDQAWQEQMKQLQMSQPALDPQMLKQLQSIDASRMNSLSPEQMEQMKQRLKQSAAQCAGASGLSELDMEAVRIEVRRGAAGAIQRGPGPAPLVMSDTGTDLETKTTEGVSNKDLRNAVMGETVGVSSRPGNDEQPAPFQTGIEADNAPASGTGGNAVWRESYTPQEQAVLEDYFQ